jgi:transposase
VSESFVKRVLLRYRTSGEEEAKPRGATVVPTIDEATLKLVQRWIEQKPDILLQELCEKLAAHQGIQVSQLTMCRAVQHLRMSRKKTLYASEQDTPRIRQQRDDYRCWLEQVEVRNLMFIDEAGIHLGMARLFARALRGERAVDAVPRNHGTNISLIGALSLDGLIASMTIKGSVDTSVFLSYIRDVLVPQLWVGAIEVMDNLKVHHAHSVCQAIEAVGARVVFLPHSPDLSPIELCWSKLKQFLRSKAASTYEALDQAMTKAVQFITENDAIGWFNHCGLFT